MKRKMLWIDTKDEAAAADIMLRYGCESESAAFRLAVRVLADSPTLQVELPSRPKHARSSPKHTVLLTPQASKARKLVK